MGRLSWKDESRADWGHSTGDPMSREQIALGAQLRIADAMELMAKNYISLQDDRDYQVRRKLDLEKDNSRMARSIRALRGTITRMKRRYA